MSEFLIQKWVKKSLDLRTFRLNNLHAIALERKPRRHFTAQQKVIAVKRHLVEGEAVSDICEALDLHPNQFYEWQKQLFNGATQAFVIDNKRKIKTLEKEIEALNARISDKDSVIAELLEEHVNIINIE